MTCRIIPTLCLLIVVLANLPAQAAQPETIRVSIDSGGNQGNNRSFDPVISADGRYVAFASYATNLVVGDTNGVTDVFIHDRQTGDTTRVSVDSSGSQGNGYSYGPAVSADGRYVAYYSQSTNLVANDSNKADDVFVHDRQTGNTTRVSIDSSGAQGNAGSYGPAFSADGRYVAFKSSAANLVVSDTNGADDVFVHDRLTGMTARVSVDSSGIQGDGLSDLPALSADGRYIAFYSRATNLVSGDTNGFDDVFVNDRLTGMTTRVSVDSNGNQRDVNSWGAAISADGRYVAFGSSDIFVHDRQTGSTTLVSVDSSGNQGGNSDSIYPSISADGRYVAFSSSNKLVPEDTNEINDVFAHDRQTGISAIVSVDSSGIQGDGLSEFPALSADGRYVAFGSFATNLVAGDTNGTLDIFVRGPLSFERRFISAIPMLLLLSKPKL